MGWPAVRAREDWLGYGTRKREGGDGDLSVLLAAALHADLSRYHGVLASNAERRHLLVERARPPPAETSPDADDPNPTAPMGWMQRLRRG